MAQARLYRCSKERLKDRQTIGTRERVGLTGWSRIDREIAGVMIILESVRTNNTGQEASPYRRTVRYGVTDAVDHACIR